MKEGPEVQRARNDLFWVDHPELFEAFKRLNPEEVEDIKVTLDRLTSILEPKARG